MDVSYLFTLLGLAIGVGLFAGVLALTGLVSGYNFISAAKKTGASSTQKSSYLFGAVLFGSIGIFAAAFSILSFNLVGIVFVIIAVGRIIPKVAKKVQEKAIAQAEQAEKKVLVSA